MRNLHERVFKSPHTLVYTQDEEGNSVPVEGFYWNVSRVHDTLVTHKIDIMVNYTDDPQKTSPIRTFRVVADYTDTWEDADCLAAVLAHSKFTGSEEIV